MKKKSTKFPKEELKNPSMVKTPLGYGIITGQDDLHNQFEVKFMREDFTPEIWRAISKGGPCMYKFFNPKDIIKE